MLLLYLAQQPFEYLDRDACNVPAIKPRPAAANIVFLGSVPCVLLSLLSLVVASR